MLDQTIGFCSETNQLNATELAKHIYFSLDKIEAWPAGLTNYPKEGWDRLVSLARDIQRAKPSTAAAAFEEIQAEVVGISRMSEKWSAKQQELNDGKLFLLISVLFELPQSVPESKYVRSGSYITGNTQVNPDGTCNLAWPVV